MSSHTAANVFRERIKYGVMYSPWQGSVHICVLTFWRKGNAELYAATLNAAYEDGLRRAVSKEAACEPCTPNPAGARADEKDGR